MPKLNIVPEITPMMEQYLKIKAKHGDKILLYRMGDFYETFLEDAKTISKILGITLTKRANGKASEVPLAGFPYHALDNYLPRLLQAGHKVAICEQVEDPKKAKGVVKREVVEIISPGTTLNEKLLDQRKNNYLCVLYYYRGKYGFAAVDVSTANFVAAEVREDRIAGFVDVFNPKELIFSKSQKEEITGSLSRTPISMLTEKEEWLFTYDFAEEILLSHFKVNSLKPFGLESKPLATIAAGVILHYLKENFLDELPHITRVKSIRDDEFMLLDESTRRNLEINATLLSGERNGTLIDVIDKSLTPMGARMMKQVVNQPLIDSDAINDRLNAVEKLVEQSESLEKIRTIFKEIGDIERWISRLSTGRANARDLKGLQRAIEAFPGLIAAMSEFKEKLLTVLKKNLSGMEEIADLIDKAIAEGPPLTITEGNIIRPGYNKELDDLRDIARHGKQWLTEYAQKERKRTGIPTLKVGYNRIFGYYIDITRVHQDKVPQEYVRKQTLVNSERFITDELKQYEDKILGAEDRIRDIEYTLFQEIRIRILEFTEKLQQASSAVALTDVLASFATTSLKNNYVKPLVHNGDELYILNGRHPVVEQTLPPGEDFTPNDVNTDCSETQIMIITGPNMAGKSTYLRMSGLIVLLGQIGCFVPADECRMGVVDRIFTRVGASDSLTTGESTFMVEMNETAYILNHATPKSLILLDEIGRGTSTFDGLSIAWAVTEYLHINEKVSAKTMFATHYHELIELEKLYPRIKNFNIAVKELEGQVIFMHKIVPGGTDNSYGIHVGQMAGLPDPVIERANEVLSGLESDRYGKKTKSIKSRVPLRPLNQVDMFSPNVAAGPSPVEEELKKIDVNNTTPIEALQILNELKQKLKG